MSRIFKRGALVWSACSGGWFVIATITGVWQALAVAVGCGCMAGVFLIMGEAECSRN